MNETSASESPPASIDIPPSPQATSAMTPPAPPAPAPTSIVFGAQMSAMAIGIIVLCILLCLTLAIVVLLVYRRKKQRRDLDGDTIGGGGGWNDPNPGRRPSFKERIKDHLLPWQKAEKQREPPPIDDLVFSTIQQLPPKPPPLPPQKPFFYHHHVPANDSISMAEGYSYSTLRGTCTNSSSMPASAPPTADDLMILQSLARQREFDRAGYFVNPKNRHSVAERLEEEAMLQHLSMSSYHVW